MTNMQSTISKVFDSTGYVKVPEFLSPYMARLFVDYFTNKIRKGEWQEREKDDYGKTPTSKFQCYADPLVEIMLKQQLETIEKIVGRGLYQHILLLAFTKREKNLSLTRTDPLVR
jgi:hypothetical protein